jgi:aryl carrier-like protein
MELNEDCLSWTSACEQIIFDVTGLHDLIDKLDSVLQRIIQVPNESAIELTEGGIVICGLPAFQTNESERIEYHSSINGVPKTSQVEEWSATESTIRTVLSEVSHIPKGEITKVQTIFNLGLDSIVAIKVSSLLRKRSISLSVGEMLKAATIANMAQLADAKGKDFVMVRNGMKNPRPSLLGDISVQEALESAKVGLNEVHKTLPCSSGQVYMLSTWQNSEGSEFYPTFQFTTSKHLHKMRLNQAWDTLCKKSSILRTMFASTGERQIPFLQIVLKENPNPIIWLSHPPEEGRLNADFRKPLVSLAVVLSHVNGLSDSATPRLFLKIHHALYDGVSLDILLRQLESLYRDPHTKLESRLDFEDFLAQELMSFTQPSRKDFWSMYLSKSDNVLVPIRDPSFEHCTYERSCLYSPRLIPSTTSLSKVARVENVSFQAIFLASYATVHAKFLSRLGFSMTQHSDIIFGIYLANRSHPLPGLPTLAAPTVNLVPLRIREALHVPVLEIAKGIQHDLQEISSVENSRVGLWEINDWTGVLIDCFVNFLTLPDSANDHEENGAQELSLSLKPVALDPGSEENSARMESEREWFQQRFEWGRVNAVKDVYRVSPQRHLPSTFHWFPLLYQALSSPTCTAVN